MNFTLSSRLKKLPPYLFVEIDRQKRKARQQGRDIIDLGIGDPDQPTPRHIIESLYKASKDPSTHRYALDQGMPEFRQAIAGWYRRRFGVTLDPETEVLPLIGSKEGIAHLPLAFIDAGDYALVPDPSYPPYKGGVIIAGGRPYLMPLKENNAFLPDLKKIPLSVRKKAKLMFVNYPNNPTSAVAGDDFYRAVAEFALKNEVIVASDLAYSEITFDGYRPASFLSQPEGKGVAIEFHSLSKTYNMTGWRVGWACGNASLIAALGKVKSNIDSGVFSALQRTGIEALEGPQQCVEDMCRLYQERRDALIGGLGSLGLSVFPAKATFYVWFRVPRKWDSMRFCAFLLEKADIVATPGVGFGPNGEGFVRMALTVCVDRLKEAVERMRKIL